MLMTVSGILSYLNYKRYLHKSFYHWSQWVDYHLCSVLNKAFIIQSCLQEAIVKIMKMRKKISNAQLQHELVEILRNMFLPSKKMIKEQIEWLIDHKYMKRDEENINMFIYMA